METTLQTDKGRTTGLIDTEGLPCLKWALDRPLDALRDELATMSPVDSDLMMLGQTMEELDEICKDVNERRKVIKNRLESLMEKFNEGKAARAYGSYVNFRSGEQRSLEVVYIPSVTDGTKRVWYQGPLKALRNMILENPARKAVAEKHLVVIDEIKVPRIDTARKAIEELGPAFAEAFKLCYDDGTGAAKVEIKTAPLGDLPPGPQPDAEDQWTAEVAALRGS